MHYCTSKREDYKLNLSLNYVFLLFVTKILLIGALEAKQIEYFLPQYENLAQFTLNTAIEHAQKSILIQSNNINYETKRALINTKTDTTIVTQCSKLEKNIFELTLYRHIEILCTKDFRSKLYLFDKQFLCVQSNKQFICNENLTRFEKYLIELSTNKKSSKSYLKK